MGTTEIFFILIIYLLLFGAKGIPSLAQGLGKTIRQFKDATSDIQKEIMEGANEFKKEIKSNVEDPIKSIESPMKNIENPLKNIENPIKKISKDLNQK